MGVQGGTMNVMGAPVHADLVLLGGGHSHAIVLKQWGMQPLPGVRLTLITDRSDTPYSGMLPGHIAGFYSRADCHIDLRPLAQFARAQFYCDRVVGLDLNQHQILCAEHPPVRYDLLSIDLGSTPTLPAAFADRVLPAKPISQFLERWEQVLARIRECPDRPVQLVIVGGGAGGVELALTMQRRIHQLLQVAQQPLSNLTLHLVHQGLEVLTQHNRWVRQRFRQILQQRGITLHLGQSVTEVGDDVIRCQSGLTIACDAVVWVTQASAPDWLQQTGLALDPAGFIWVDETLRSISHANVFAAGDVATMQRFPRPKAGVFAVRQGQPLFRNLQRSLRHLPLRPFRPQATYLSLIGTGDASAVASWAFMGWQAGWLWTWKDWIDRRFMRQFAELPRMSTASVSQSEGGASVLPTMHCAGCGSKVGSGVLQRVLHRIQERMPIADRPEILVGLNEPDDAAVIQIPPGKPLVQTIDYFPSPLDDPFIFGQISANHALSDLFAMGATPHSALAIATLPYGSAALMEETLYQLLSGALKTMQTAGVSLIGGHTIAGPQLAFGLSCNGWAEGRLLTKGGLQPGQALILTKALGTGTLLAAQMQRQAQGVWIDAAIAAMLQSNQAAAACLLQYGATACTDITGFGLVGHLAEMVQASLGQTDFSVILQWDALPILPGALVTAGRGILSSLQPQNLASVAWLSDGETLRHEAKFPLLFDPQTSGGLLAAVPIAQAPDCLLALRNIGYQDSAIVGQVVASVAPHPAIKIQ